MTTIWISSSRLVKSIIEIKRNPMAFYQTELYLQNTRQKHLPQLFLPGQAFDSMDSFEQITTLFVSHSFGVVFLYCNVHEEIPS